MSTKTELIRLLESRRGEDLSGEELAKELGVSRAAVWKAINALRQEGYRIEAATNRGYCLAEETDRLSAEGVRLFLNKELHEIPLTVLNTVDSTNHYAKQTALKGEKSQAVILANQQTAGKGRLGRSFFSPKDSGLYMSILLKPQIPLEEAIHFTITAALAVCLAVEECTDLTPQIKWVNDIFVNGKKVCGILTEAISDFETGFAQSVIIGIGVNVKTPPSAFPEELKNIAVSLNNSALQRNRLAASVLNHFFKLNGQNNFESVRREYKNRLFILGKTITYTRGGESFTALAEDINSQGNLIVRFTDGTSDVLRSGEISIGSGNVT